MREMTREWFSRRNSPFVNMSGDPANEYFSDGLAETTLDMLAQVPDLKVIARTSSFAFKGKPTDMREIGRQLGAAHLLEGSVQQAGETVRITAQLVRVSDGSHLWSKRYDRQLTDVFRIQDEIAMAVVDVLALELSASTQKRIVRRRTDSVAAYDAYLKGIALLPRRDVPEMRQALAHFEGAIRIDPDLRARLRRCTRRVLPARDLRAPSTEAERSMRRYYLERALQLAPELGEAHVGARCLAGRRRRSWRPRKQRIETGLRSRPDTQPVGNDLPNSFPTAWAAIV